MHCLHRERVSVNASLLLYIIPQCIYCVSSFFKGFECIFTVVNSLLDHTQLYFILADLKSLALVDTTTVPWGMGRKAQGERIIGERHAALLIWRVLWCEGMHHYRKRIVSLEQGSPTGSIWAEFGPRVVLFGPPKCFYFYIYFSFINGHKRL